MNERTGHVDRSGKRDLGRENSKCPQRRAFLEQLVNLKEVGQWVGGKSTGREGRAIKGLNVNGK